MTGSLLKAQTTCRILNEKNQPVEGAMVQILPLSGASSLSLYSDRKGEIEVPETLVPSLVKVQSMGYRSLTDTIKRQGNKELSLRAAPGELGEVVVTGGYMPGYQAESVHQVDVITRDEIEKRGAVNVKDLFSQELNMQVSNDPALGSSLSINGTGGEHIKFLIDGVPVTGRKNGTIDLSQLNLNNVERVEIIKGPMSVIYGSDALGGVVNLITRKPKNDKATATFNGYYETVGTYNADFSGTAGIGKTSFGINGGRNFFDGWSPQDTGRWQQWKPREQYFGDFRIATTFSKSTLNFTSSYFREEVFNKSEPVLTPYFAYATDQNYRTWRVVQQLQFNHQINNQSMLQFTGAYSWYQYIKNTWRKDLVDLSEALTADTLDDDTTRFNTIFGRAVYTLKPEGADWDLMAGAELNHDRAVGKRIDNQEHSITEAAAFGSFNYKWNSLDIRPSARFIYNSQYATALIPALNLMYTQGKFTGRAGYSAGFRSPSLKELYLDFNDNGIHNVQGNPDLKAEHSQNITASGEWRKSGDKTSFSTTLTVFYNAISDRITLVEKDIVTGLYMYDNLDKFYARGAELKSRYALKQFTVEAGFAYTGTNDVQKEYDQQADIAWYPEVNAACDYTVKKTRTTVSVFWKLYGERPVYRYENDIPVRYLNESYQLLDLSVRQPLLKDHLQLTAGVKNLLDVTDVNAVSSGGVHSGNTSAGTPVSMGTYFFTKISFTF